MTISPDDFRAVIGNFASGVTVITTIDDDERYGTTASAVASLSLEPPMVLVCLNQTSETGAAIRRSGHLAINILSEGQADAAMRFAGKGGDKFAGVAHRAGARGAPLLDQALATLECRVVAQHPAGTHSVFHAEVESGEAGAGSPLAYFRGRFGRLEIHA